MAIDEKLENQESLDVESAQGSKDNALAAEWEESQARENVSNEESSDYRDPTTARVLNQEEIDSLLGFDDTDSTEQQNGLYAIINSSLVSYERLPMLEVVFDRLIRVLSTSLRNFTSDNVEVSLDGLQSFRFGDYLNSIPLPAMLGVFKAEEWENYGLVIVDSPLIYSIVDVLLGGRRGTAMMRVEGRPYTTIERNLVERMLFLVLNDMSAAFDPLSPVTFRFERLETNPRFTAIARPANAAVVVKLRIDMEDRGGRLEIVLPYATLEPVRELLLQMFMGEKFGRDSIWENHLINELLYTKVKLLAVIDEFMLPLSEVMEWKVGTQISLNCTAQSPVELRCASVPLFVGQMGKKNNKISVKIDRKYNKEDVDEL
jgi:flagellar motor switch protein FliM